MKSLEEILQALGSKSPFYKDCYYDHNKETFHDLTKSGAKAYAKLEDILCCLVELNVINNYNIDLLDNICNENARERG